MKKFNYKHYIRKAHRYLGFFIGLQFILWTIGGLYFSWTNLDEIHGDHLRAAHAHGLNIQPKAISPSEIIENLKRENGAEEITRINIVEVLGRTYYEIGFAANGKPKTVLADMSDGVIRRPISETDAQTIAQNTLSNPGEIKQLTYLTTENVSKHHEYREKPLPAWAVTFENDVHVYLSADTGQVGAVRTTKWRIFDFLWMLHTMDFEGRDNINNYVLRAFSLLGITTVLSGFALFFASSRFLRRLRQRRPSH